MNKSVEVFDPQLPISKSDLATVKARRKTLKAFIKSEMVEGIDFGTIAGTKNPSLYKPGAEKLAQLFGLGARFPLREHAIDHHANFAMFTYTCEIYHLRTGTAIAQCEGLCNSLEKQYRYRIVDGAREETQIGDILNTLMKMGQKRAYVGGIIQATGASDFYTQDIDSPEDAKSLGLKVVAKAIAPIPKVTRAMSVDKTQSPVCCNYSMIASKHTKNHWYCLKCKKLEKMEGR